VTRIPFPLALTLLLAACSANFRLAGQPAAPPRPPHCRIATVSTAPGPGYVEIATITVDPGGIYRDPNYMADEFRKEICGAGGEVLMTEVSEGGRISRGVVFRRIAMPPAPPPPPASACQPICSPGFDCRDGVCVPLCNPACTADEICGRDRLCHPKQ
jgi:hypothetical protein